MKRFYALSTLALAFTISASADQGRRPAKTDFTRPGFEVSMASTNTATALKVPGTVTPRENASINDIAGEYDYTGLSYLSGKTHAMVVTIEVIDEIAGEVSISGFPQDFSISGYYDQESGILAIDNNQYLGVDSEGDQCYFYIKEVVGSSDLNDGATSAMSTDGTLAGSTFTFPADNLWAIGDPNDEELGWWMLDGEVVLTRYIAPEDPNEGWTSKGKATLQDGWLLPLFGLDQTDPANWYEVELQQNDENNNIYRLVNPYKGECPIADYNEYPRTGYIEFDVTDPDHVVFANTLAGFSLSQIGLTEFYPHNSLTAAMLKFNLTIEEAVSQFGNQILYTTFKDGVVTLSTEGGLNDACFGIQGESEAAYGWQNQNGYALNMETKIFFPGAIQETDPNEGWTSLGNATIQDGWILPMFNIDPSDPEYLYEAELQQNDKNKNLYRVVDPYKGESPIAEYNRSKRTGYIQFDVTDPKHVVFDVIGAGLDLSAEVQVSEFYCYNTLGLLVNYYDITPGEIIAQLGDQIFYTTFKDGVVLLRSQEGGSDGYLNDACFGVSGDKTAGYVWQDTSGNAVNMEARIIFPASGIENVSTTVNDGQVEYFNLQGIRVNDPAAGQIVIRRQGNEVSKILVR